MVRFFYALIVFFLIPFVSLRAQSIFWLPINVSGIRLDPKDELRITPDHAAFFEIDPVALRSRLELAPLEDFSNQTKGMEFTIPYPDGSMQTFRIFRTHTMHPDLGEKFPEIRTFLGTHVRNKAQTIRLDITQFGFHAMVLGHPDGQIFIDPYAWPNNKYCQSYYKKDLQNNKSWFCGSEDEHLVPPVPSSDIKVDERVGTCNNLRVYRLAVAGTGEYTAFHGGTVAGGLAAMNTTMNRVNGVYEKEAAIRMVIIANNNLIIYTNGATDPYTNNDGVAMLDENQTNLDAVIMTANYDIGHVFSTNGGGVAQLQSPCDAPFKAMGVTGTNSPTGDPFDIDYVAHEIGHQFGGNHTQANDDCNRNDATAVEPGSGYSIMGYAGVCSPFVQFNSDANFHPRNLVEIASFLAGSGGTCPTTIATGNSAPVVAALPNYNIPKSTPFVLSTTATDPNGDALTYSWDQMDGVTTYQTQPPVSTNTQGPLFKGFLPVSTGTRYFPRLSDLTTNTNYDWEELPSVARTLNFRLQVRDNRANGGCASEDDVALTVNGTAGPFLVTAPNTATSFPGNSTGTVTWDVAGTTASPISVANVEILFSSDGGLTYPTTLVASTPNDGTHGVTWPSMTTTQARVMVKALNNVFFDISNTNFTLTTPLPVELLDFTAALKQKTVQLDWATATESNTSAFHVERSTDAREWLEIGVLQAAGQSEKELSYQFTDQKAPFTASSQVYYRLAIRDHDGSVRYSDIRQVRYTTNVPALMPNPVKDLLKVQFLEPAGDLRLTITDITGKLVQTIEVNDLQTECAVDLSYLPEGAYMMTIYYGNAQEWQERFLKVK